MKLRTIKELINGKYENIDLNKTYTGKNMNRLNCTYIFVYVSYLILKMPFAPTEHTLELALKQATIGAGICMLLVIITGIFGLYFALCETYIGDCTND